MKTTFYLNGKKTSRKALTEKIGADRLKRYMRDGRECDDRLSKTAIQKQCALRLFLQKLHAVSLVLMEVAFVGHFCLLSVPYYPAT